MLTGLFIYSINTLATHFPCVLFQTRYGANCFARRAREDEAGSVFLINHTPVAFLLANHKARYLPLETTYIRLYRPLRCPFTKSCPRATNIRRLPFNRIRRVDPAEVRAATMND